MSDLGDNPLLEQNDFRLTTPYGGVDIPLTEMTFTLIPRGVRTMSANIITLHWNEDADYSDPLLDLQMVAACDTAGFLASDPLYVLMDGAYAAFGATPFSFGTVAQGTLTFQLGVLPANYTDGAVDVKISFQDGVYAVRYGSKETLPCGVAGNESLLARMGGVQGILLTVITEPAPVTSGTFTWSIN